MCLGLQVDCNGSRNFRVSFASTFAARASGCHAERHLELDNRQRYNLYNKHQVTALPFIHHTGRARSICERSPLYLFVFSLAAGTP